MTAPSVRPAEPQEADALARVWYDAGQDAHARILPAELARLRTLESFRERLIGAMADTRVVGQVGDPRGFCIIKDDELYQLFVDGRSRGAGVATALLADAEDRLWRSGVRTAWLACAIGNDRAARFYEKSGWQRAGVMINQAVTSEGLFPVEVWRYEKVLPAPMVNPP